jgi:hypothetical protein
MRICGVDISGGDAVVALVDVAAGSITPVGSDTKRISLKDDEAQDSLRLFADTFGAFLRNNNVELVAIKKRNKKGQFAGGSVTFKIEGIIQLTAPCAVRLVSSQTVSAAQRKHAIESPPEMNKYQHDAFLTACCVGLADNG